MITVKLTQPIEAHGEKVSELTFRDPIAEDIGRCGMPFTFTTDGAVKAETQIVIAYISRLGSIPLSSANSLSAADYMSCWAEIMSFFGVAQATS